MTRPALAFALALVVTAGPAPVARAADPAPNQPLAEALFREGRARMEAGAYAEACPKLAESQRLDPRLGTLLNLAVCHARQGRTATAWGEFAAAATEAQRAGRKENENLARTQMRALDGQLSRIVIVAPSASPPAGLVVKLDGAVLGAGALGSALPVDPGPHVVEASAAGRATVHLSVTAATGPSTATVSLPPLVTVERPPPNGDAAVDASPAAPSPAHRSYVGPLVLGGAAIVAVGLGTAFGVEAFAKKSDGGVGCNPQNQCPQSSLDATSEGRSFATGSTLAFSVAAAAAIGAFTWLLVDKPAPDAASARVAAEGRGFVVRF